MQDPSNPPKTGLACPACHSPISPGDKFCEECGAKIPALFTCSRCGTQFIHAAENCELCGGPLVLSEIAEPASPATERVAIKSRAAGQQVTGPGTSDAPDEEGEEVVVPVRKKPSRRHPEETADEVPLPAKKKLHQYSKEIREPDTEELLEEFGKEYDPEETLESRRKAMSRPPKKPDTKDRGAAPLRGTRTVSGTVDDALLLSPDKPDTKRAKPRSDRKRMIAGGIALLAMVAGLYFFGLPMLAGTGSPGAPSSVTIIEDTPVPVGTPAVNATPSARATPGISGALVPQPTQTLAQGQKLYFQVQKSPVTARILVTFAGSAGHGSIKSADVTVTHPDGSVATGMILPLKGITEIVLDGSKETDRVEILARMSDGGTYRVYDALVPILD